MIELTAVSETDSATSPLASMENTLLDEPPGQHAMSIIPMKNIGGNWNVDTRHQAIAGSKMSWPKRPVSMAPGRLAMSTKSEGLRVSPRSNIRSVRMGRTMRIEFNSVIS
jgi:hypothetical protein